MAYKHFFDYYTIKVRKKNNDSYMLIKEFGDEKHDLFLLMSNFINGLVT